jgi:hypothetical protein
MMKPALQIAEFNNPAFGRLGNQFFKYLFLKWAQRKTSLIINCDSWIGHDIFSIPQENKSASTSKIFISNQEYNINYNPNVELQRLLDVFNPDFEVVDIYGYFQFHTSHYQSDKEYIIDLFSLSNALKFLYQKIKSTLNTTIISIHIRRGDYLLYENHDLFWSLDIEKIIVDLKTKVLNKLDDYLLYIATDDLEYCIETFRLHDIKYITHKSFVEQNIINNDLICDILFMINSDVSVIANSSFSFFTSMLNCNSKVFLRPCPFAENLIFFDPWDSQVLLSKNPI